MWIRIWLNYLFGNLIGNAAAPDPHPPLSQASKVVAHGHNMAKRSDSTPSIGSCTEVDIISVVAGCIYFWLSVAVQVDSTGGHI